MSRLYVVTFIHAFDHQQNVYEVCTAPGLAERRLAEIASLHTRRNKVKIAARYEQYQDAIDAFADECKHDNTHQLYVSECDPKPGQTVVVREPDFFHQPDFFREPDFFLQPDLFHQPHIQETGEPNCVLAAYIQKAVAAVFAPAQNSLAKYTSQEVALIHAYAASRLAQHASAVATQLRQRELQEAQH